MAGAGDQHHVLLVEMGKAEPGHLGRIGHAADHHVDGAVPQQRQQVAMRARFDPQRGLGPQRAEPHRDPRKQQRCRGRQDAHPDAPAPSRGMQRGDAGLERLQADTGMVPEQRALRRQHQPSPLAPEQRNPQQRLELGQGAAQRRLRQAVAARGGRQRALGRDVEKGADVAQLDAGMHNHLAMIHAPFCIIGRDP